MNVQTDKQALTVFLTAEEKAALKAKAQENGRPMTSEARFAIRAALYPQRRRARRRPAAANHGGVR